MAASYILPEIISLVHCQLVNEGQMSLAEWKALLQLLHVCSHWRNSLLPLTYKYVLFECKSMDSQPETQYTYADNDPNLAAIFSNTSLVQSTPYYKHARNIYFKMSYRMGVLQFMHVALQQLQNSIAAWPSITYLHLEWTSLYNRRYWSWETGSFEVALQLAARMAMCMPGINKISCSSKNCDELASIMLTLCVNTYASQLHRLSSSINIETSSPIALSKLICLDIINARENPAVSNVDTACLKSLRVHGLVLGCQRNMFKPSTDSDEWLFSKLQKLHIENSDEAVGSENSTLYGRLAFPELKTLVVDLIYRLDRILTMPRFPKILPKLVICKGDLCRLTLFNVEFDYSLRKELTKNTASINDIHVIHLLNYLLGRSSVYSDMHVQLSNQLLVYVPKVLDLQRLQVLDLPNTNILMLVRVLPYMLSLKRLILGKYLAGSSSLFKSLGSREPDYTALNASIEHVQLEYPFQDIDKVFTVLFKVVLLRIPSLKWLEIPQAVSVYERVKDECQTECTHLQSLVVFYRT
ncbi:hypothetical protein BX667DRAFT_183503 [Coemansia mojavensis]|nr:hypothetical protein BX667DRAFT_183503 [Coemansia mojavensis]